MTTITIPDFQYAAQYYPEILEVLIQRMRVDVPEITDEDPAEPFIQLLRSMALSGHYNNVLLDLVAKESYLPTASLRASVKRLLELIDYDLAQASPAVADLIIRLNGTVSSTTQITVAGAQFTTQATSGTPAIPYEDTEGHSVQRTDQLAGCYAYNATGAVWTDHTMAANTPGSTFIPGWGTPEAGDLLYFIHQSVQWDSLLFDIVLAAADITGVWEYYDGYANALNPESVTNMGSYLRIKINPLLGTSERTGASIRVMCQLTGAVETLTSAWDGTDNYIDTTGFLGQISPSTLVAGYSVAAEWREPENLTDETIDYTVTGDKEVTFDLPQSRTTEWVETTVNGLTGYAMRYRIISVGGAPSAPTLDTVDIDNEDVYLPIVVTQGESRKDDPLGSSTGLPDQEFTLANYPVIDDETLTVSVDEGGGAVAWYRVENFLNSTTVDRHYTVDFDDDGKATIKFGDGVNGKIPASGVDNISAVYRTMDEVDGNVGASAIVQNQTGSGYIASVWNPRPASGYQAREGSTAESLETAKAAGVASLRTGSTAASPEEVETLTVAWIASDGSKPFTRCLAIEEGYGVKTIEAVIVAAGGAASTAVLLDELASYFNSDTANKHYGVLVANHQVVPVNYTPHIINVTAIVYGGNQASVETALTALLNPESKDTDGNWTWDFGGEVPLSRIISEIMLTTPKPRKTTVSTPSSDVTLALRELPMVGTVSITIVP